MQRLTKIATGLPTSLSSTSKEFCEPCVLGKQARLPGKGHFSKTTSRLERIHTDLSGGGRTLRSLSSLRYLMLITDDYTRHRWSFFLQNKSDALSKLQEFATLMFNKFGESIKAIRSNNGGEFDSQACHTWYSAQGITFEPSAPYAHQQNGISERSNRYILEKSCTILLKSGLPKYLWAEAASTAVYLANRSPTRGLDRAITPFKAWNGLGNQPDLSYLHVFGCQAYYVDEFAKSKGKMASRSLKAWFIGYEPGSYRL